MAVKYEVSKWQSQNICHILVRGMYNSQEKKQAYETLYKINEMLDNQYYTLNKEDLNSDYEYQKNEDIMFFYIGIVVDESSLDNVQFILNALGMSLGGEIIYL